MPATRDPFARLRALCLSFPEAHEQLAWGEATFRVRGKMFAMCASAGTHHSVRPAVWIKAKPTNQALVLAARPDRYFSPPYVGKSGWIGVWLDRRPPYGEVAGLLDDAWRQTAPRRLVALHEGTSRRAR